LKIKFFNPYSIQENLLIKIYKFTTKHVQFNISLYFRYAIGILFKRLTFELVARNIVMPVTAQYKGIDFIARSTNSQFHSIYYDGFRDCYEPDVFATIDQFLPQNGVFFDIGSNWGYHSFIAALEKGATVYSFEPNRAVYNDLKRISSSLCCDHLVNAFNIALGDSDGRLEITQTGFESGSASISKDFLDRNIGRPRPEKLIDRIMLDRMTGRPWKKVIRNKVDVRKLDDVVGSDVKVDLIKIDVEGAEIQCLLGAVSILKRSRPKVIFELHTDALGSTAPFSDFFESLGYKLYIVEPNVPTQECVFRELVQLQPLTQYNILASVDVL
jgi:FkbM family methyltransferase